MKATLAKSQPVDTDAIDPGPAAPAGDEALWQRWDRPSTRQRRDAWWAASPPAARFGRAVG